MITLKRVLLSILLVLVVALAVLGWILVSPLTRFRGLPQPVPVAWPSDSVASGEELRSVLEVLAEDSMAGRRTGTAGARRAATYLVSELQRRGVSPASTTGFVQMFSLVEVTGASGRRHLVFPDEAIGNGEASSEIGPEVTAQNLVGLIPGSDPARAEEAVIVSAHYDHLGIGSPVAGDSIYNGADDNASGVLGVLEIARAMAAHPPPRTVLLLLTSSEEFGIRGARWYADHPLFPLEQTVAVLNLDTVGRPDPMVGGRGWSWLTGFDRTAIGEVVRYGGLPISPDPRPWRRYDYRSDHAAFSDVGVPAHTLCSYGDHDDFHRPSDETDGIDFEHLSMVIQATVGLVRELASIRSL